MKRLLPIFALLVATRAFAQDTSATMATLNGEKAECRYLMSLCGEVVELTETRSWDAASRRLRSLTQAAEVLKAKHDKPPACLKACDAMLAAAAPRKSE